MKNQRMTKLVSCLVLFALISIVFVFTSQVKADSEGVYIPINSSQGGGSITENLANSYDTLNLTVDISNATNQNDDCQIRLSNDSSETAGFYWTTSTPDPDSAFYEQSLSVYNITDTTELDFNTTTFSPNLVWDGNTISWYGNNSNVLLGSIGTSAYFSNVSMTYIDTTMAFDSGSVTINIQTLSATSPTSTPPPTPSSTPIPTPSPTPIPSPTPMPTATPSPTPIPSSTPTPSSTSTPASTPSPTPASQASATPAPTPVPTNKTDITVPEFPAQMKIIALVVSMTIVLVAVVFAKNNAVWKIRRVSNNRTVSDSG